ncbi:hypothetical protein ONZ45_g7271 [Pleurotus djamor]|nr:hypothetical protein ONZ45_g7271 [Pleurotus djamor]
MSQSIVGTLKIDHSVDPNGSLALTIPIQLPPARLAPEIALNYHSASNTASTIGTGWTIKGISIVERTPATIAQDGFAGSINYDGNDRFTMNGQRLINIGGNEYRYEVEQWSRVVAVGTDAANPQSWIEYLPDGSTRTYGTTSDSNIRAVGRNSTRAWATSEYRDSFSNYVTYTYNNDTTNGSFSIARLSFGGNRNLNMAHQRQVEFQYQTRPDLRVNYVGGSRVATNLRLISITSRVQNRLVHTHRLAYDQAPSTGISRLTSLTLVDPSNVPVRPLLFSWINGNPTVFDPVRAPVVLNPGGSNPQVFPMDVSARGRSDLVIGSRVLVNNAPQLRLQVHPANNGIVAATPSSTFSGLTYPSQLIPLDINGDGRNDFLHVAQSINSYTLTIILSTPQGFQAQSGMQFAPEFIGGQFHAGDFEGNGRIGLVYVYQVLRSGTPQIRFIQFTSNGTAFTALPALDGPAGVSLGQVKTVVGDLNGNNAEDVFLMSSRLVSGSSVVAIDLLESRSGRLAFRTDRPLLSASQSIPFLQTTTFLPYGADDDGKTSILVASRNLSGNLQFQVLRSSGPTLLPPGPPVTTNIAFNGNVTLARTTSPFSVDIVNTFSTIDNRTNVDVLRFFADSFVRVASVTQPGVSSSMVSWADLRGLGRVDCVLTTQNVNGQLSVSSLPCSTLQPIDYVSGYENGLGGRVLATYAPLSDPTTYTTDATSRSAGAGSPLTAVSGMARNVSFTTSLSSSAATAGSQVGAQTRSQIVYFPSYVVKDLVHTPYRARSDVVDRTAYTYRNARYSYDGRGWQGFESISKLSQTLNSRVTSDYHQEFPLVGLVRNASSAVITNGETLQVTNNNWTPVSINGGRNRRINLSNTRDQYFERGSPTFNITTTYTNDDYGNITTTSMQTSTNLSLVINAEYQNQTSPWVIGNKRSERVVQGAILKHTRWTYVPGSSTIASQEQWIRDNVWSTQNIDYDAAGNESVIRGPGRALRRLGYDPTYTNCQSSTVFTATNASIIETATYDLAQANPITTTSPNGEVTAITYDVLGRAIETRVNNTVVTRLNYTVSGNDFMRNEFALLDSTNFYRTTSHIDGFGRTWRTERPSLDNPNVSIISATQYDGAGRLTHKARDYFSGSNPVWATASYDALSRVIRKVMPAPSSDTSPLTITTTYAFERGMIRANETRSDGRRSEVASQFIRAIPNPEPSTSNFVKNVAVEVIDETGHRVNTSFDGLGRPISISQPNGATRRVIHHTRAAFDDDVGRLSVNNALTGQTVNSVFDWNGRIVEKYLPEETLRFQYDTGGLYTRDRLVSVASSHTNPADSMTHRYDYDIHGNLTSDSLTISGQTYTSRYAWTVAGALTQATNPDGSVTRRTLLPDGQSVRRIDLFDASNVSRASVQLETYNNVFSKPSTCRFGNGLVATSTLSANGTAARMDLNRGNTLLHSQRWSIDSFSRIGRHEVQGESIQPGEGDNSFDYNSAGQISRRTNGRSRSNPEVAAQETFTYDASGNLREKGDLVLVTNGWQLSEVRNRLGATQYRFEYSPDGNMTQKRDASGSQVLRRMDYNSENRLVRLDGTTFAYDYNGRLVKATLPNGTTRIYPTISYEVELLAGGARTQTSYIIQGHRRASLTSTGSSSEARYFHTDHLGSTVAVSNSSGTIISQYEYDPHGRVRLIRGNDLARYKYSGKELFGDLYYFGARFYDPELGRFLTLDNYPLALDGIKPSTFNMYSFSRNDPINFIDLNGNVPWWHWFVDILLIVVGVALTVAVGTLLPIVGSALIGAGVNGLVYDIQSAITGEGNDRDWGIQLGIGALAGAISGGASAALNAVMPAATMGNLVAKGVGITLKSAAQFAGRTAVRLAVQVGVNSGTSALSQVLTNIADGKPPGEGVGQAAATGAWQGLISGAMDAQFNFYDSNPTAINKFWRKTGSYSLVPETKSLGRVIGDLSSVISSPPTSVGLGMLAYGINQSKSQEQSSQAPANAPNGPSNSSNANAGVGGNALMIGGQIAFPRFLPVEKTSVL